MGQIWDRFVLVSYDFELLVSGDLVLGHLDWIRTPAKLLNVDFMWPTIRKIQSIPLPDQGPFFRNSRKGFMIGYMSDWVYFLGMAMLSASLMKRKGNLSDSEEEEEDY